MKLLIVLFLPLALQISLHTGNRPLLSGPDTLNVTTAGTNNLVVIDSLQLYQAANDTLLINSLQGEITQSGRNNSITIKTKGETPNNKKQITNKHQKTNNKNQTDETCNQKPETCNQKPATIKIKQSGKNNSVKINSR